jgi:hypothetical protein
MGFSTGAGGLKLLAPLGLSFFTLQMISYLVDVYKHQMEPERRWLEFFIFVLYFPKFISGPIERAKTFLPKLAADKKISWEQVRRGAALIFIGVVRKIVRRCTERNNPGGCIYPAAELFCSQPGPSCWHILVSIMTAGSTISAVAPFASNRPIIAYFSGSQFI